MLLPQFQSSNTQFQLMQSKWASIINPIISLPLNNGPSLVKNITITTGNNVINHKLGRTPIGWIVIDQNANIDLYRNNEFNDLTLTLNSTGAAIISLLVF